MLVLFCLSLSFFLLVSCSMTPKHKSTPSRNPLRSGASSSDSTPCHIWFCDEKARTNFSENFSRRGIHSECQVILSDFSLTFPLSSTIGVGSQFVASRSLVPLWSYKSFTLTCTDLIIRFLSLTLAFEVCAL